MDSRAKELVRIGDGLFAAKSQWDTFCQEVAENFYPLRADFTKSFTLGDDFATGLMDSYPVQASRTLGDAPSAMLRQGNWFEVGVMDEEIGEETDVQKWLEDTTRKFRKLIYDRRANFVRATNEADHDWVNFGNPVLSVEESQNRDHLLFRSWHPKECAWLENSAGRIDHLQRSMPMSARKIMGRWGKTAHADIQHAAKIEPAKEFNVRHIAIPAEEMYGDDRKAKRENGGMSFVSLYIDCEHEEVLGEGGLPVFNYVVPRWKTISGYPQGFSPSTVTALPDGRSLQELSRILIEQGEKAVDPPVIAKGELFRDSVNFYAGGLTYADIEGDGKLRDYLEVLNTTGQMNIGLEMKQDMREMIAESFLLNKLLMPAQREMTAFETQARLAEFRRAVLPFFGPIEHEYHLPLLDVAFALAQNSGALTREEMPESLQETGVTFTFESPLHTAEGREMVQAFQESVQILAGAAQFDQSIPTIVDFKNMTRDAVKGTGAPADWFTDEEAQKAAADAAEQVQQLNAAAATLREGAGVGKDIADASVALKEAGLG